MTQEELVSLIIGLVEDYLMDKAPEGLGSETVLFGPGDLLDSLGLVSVLMDIEGEVNDQLNLEITIADDRAMSQKSSPFRTIGRLADYIHMLVQEQNE